MKKERSHGLPRPQTWTALHDVETLSGIAKTSAKRKVPPHNSVFFVTHTCFSQKDRTICVVVALVREIETMEEEDKCDQVIR